MISAALWLSLALAPATPTTSADPQEEAVVSEIAAIEAEIARGIRELRLADAPAPYAATVRLVRASLLSLDGSYGGVITDASERQAIASVEVRVGSPERDNGGYFGQDGAQGRFLLPLDEAPAVTRKKLWLAMDMAYRSATVTYAQKQAILARMAAERRSRDLGPGPAAAPRLAPAAPEAPPIDREGLRRLVAELSARYSAHPEIDNGDVFLQILRVEITTITGEGVVLREHHDRAVLAAVADTRALDGMQLDHGRAIHLQATPRVDEGLRRVGEALVDRVLRELGEQAAAPMIEDDYDGPVLFVGGAGPQLLAATVATQASGKPAPLSDSGRLRDLEPLWQESLGKPVLPDFLDLIDDPRAEGFGAYSIDAEGFVAEPLTLVRRGVLESLLMTREPNEWLSQSNGRARISPVLMSGPAISNLRLESRQRGRSRALLERELLRRAREDGYEFAYVIESLRDGGILGPVPREGASTFGSSRKVVLPVPARIWRIEAGGKRTLVRGAVLGPASMRVLRRIRAVGDRQNVEAMRFPAGPAGGFGAETGMDGVLSFTIDAQVSSPDLLIDGLEIQVERGEHEKLPTLVHPLRDQSWKK
ncbi:MAG: hypothetical protein IPK80_11015 [Nannocystis sp.]|nr:hypothetical protein [Nannocystis sp.]